MWLAEDQGFGAEIFFDFETEAMVRTMVLTSGQNAPSKDPKSFSLSALVKGRWEVLESWRDVSPFGKRNQQRVFPVRKPQRSARYKLHLQKNHGGHCFQLTRIQLFENPASFEENPQFGKTHFSRCNV